MTDSPDAAAEFADLLSADVPDPAQLQSRVRRGGAAARAAVVSLAGDDSAPRSLRFRSAVLAADACADDSPLRARLADAASEPAADALSELLEAAELVARPDGPAATLLSDAAVTADLLTAAVDARPDDPRIAAAVLQALGDSSGFTLAVRPVRSRENATKVLRNGMALLGRTRDDSVLHALEQVLLARVTSAGNAMNDEILAAVIASPSGRGPDLVADLARAGVPGIRRQAQRALGMDVEPEHDDAGETAMVMYAISQRNQPGGVGAGLAALPAAPLDPVPVTLGSATPPVPAEPAGSPPAPARKRSWLARLFGLGRP